MKSDKNIPIKVLKQLMIHKTLTTAELTRLCDCNRKSIYSAVATLECIGFHVDVNKSDKRMSEYTLSEEIFGSD